MRMETNEKDTGRKNSTRNRLCVAQSFKVDYM